MSIVNSIKTLYNSALETIGAKPAPKAVDNTKPLPAQEKPVGAHSLQNKDRAEASEQKMGTAQLSIAKDGQITIEKWQAAGKGPKLDLGPVKNDSKLAHLNQVMEHINKKYPPNSKEIANVREFMKDITKEYGNKDINFILSEGIRNIGITEKQIDMLAKGDFPASTYVAMANSGQSIV